MAGLYYEESVIGRVFKHPLTRTATGYSQRNEVAAAIGRVGLMMKRAAA
ncbi:MAG: hypothetical protein Q8N17_16530 [Burkholderiaceae bacterium]|nr:hypothetical protein [Burkholderiaceae bacterium]